MRSRAITKIILCLCGLVFITSVIWIISDRFHDRKDAEYTEKIRELYPYSNLQPSSMPDYIDEEEDEDNPVEKETISEDFHVLLEANRDTVGWLTAGEDINHPVVQYDNEYYLTHNFSGEEDSNGTLFVNEMNNLWPRDKVILIHGHNMNSGMQFGHLSRYSDAAYLSEYPLVTFRTIRDDNNSYYVPVAGFSASMLEEKDEYFDLIGFCFEREESNEPSVSGKTANYSAYLTEITDRSYWASPADVCAEDELLVLVTCGRRRDDSRFMLFCRRLRDGETPESITSMFTDRKW